jgi:predicted dehydrogenase
VSYFTPLLAQGRRLRVGLVGAGGMGLRWLDLLDTHPDVDLVAVIDLNLTAAAAAASVCASPVIVSTSIERVLTDAPLDAIVNVTVPAAHATINLEALRRGLAVLCEKPIVPTVREAFILAAAAQSAERLLMTSQSRRYYPSFDQFASGVGALGSIGLVSTEFHTGPHFGGFRDRMEHPLLLDMAIHAFDACRHLLGRDPVSVYCEEFNPAWSWYEGGAAATAIFEMQDGPRFVFSGSWCNEGFPTSWNGEWTVRAARGTAKWDGTNAPTVDGSGAGDSRRLMEAADTESPQEIAGALADFLQALRTGSTPYGDIHSNIWSLAMVQAAVESAESGGRIVMEHVMSREYHEACSSFADEPVNSQLVSWRSHERGLARGM